MITFTLDELMRLDDTDHDQLDAIEGRGVPEIEALWWALFRAELRERGEGVSRYAQEETV